MARLSAQYSKAARISDAIAGVDYYLFLKDLLAHWDERKDALPALLKDLSSRIFTASNVTVSFTGSAEDRELFWEAGGMLGLSPSDCTHRLEVPMSKPCNEAFVIPSNVSYVGAGMGPSPHDDGSFGVWSVAQRVLSYDYLWNEVRVKGGAYGTGFRRMQSGIEQFWSYRDPGIDATLARYDAASAWLEAWDPTEDEFTGYVVSTVASHDAPTKPRQLARRQDVLHFSHKPEGWRDQVRSEELSATAQVIKSLSKPLADLHDCRTACVFGPREAIEASSVAFDTIVDLMA
jgi:Zn-dependent M16 (insulinase) family peptidase